MEAISQFFLPKEIQQQVSDLETMRHLLDKAGIQYSCWPYPDDDTIMMEIEPKEKHDDLSEEIWFDFTIAGELKSCGNFVGLERSQMRIEVVKNFLDFEKQKNYSFRKEYRD